MFKNIEELKNRIVDYLKDIIKNENNKNAIELINKSGYLAAEAQGEIKIYTDKEKTKGGSLHLTHCKISGADGRENNRHAKQFIKDNTIQDLLSAAVEEVEKDNLKLNQAESNKHLLVDLQDKINNYFNSLSIEIENINVRFSDHNIEYYLNFSDSIGDKYFNIYFKLQDNNYIYDDKYKEEKHVFKNVEEILKHFINEISPAAQKKISFLKMYSIVENNFKNNIDKKILFENKNAFYTATIDNQYITLYEVNRKKEKPIYNYLYLNQFIDLFIKDNIDKFIIIDNNTDLSIKNLRNLISSNNCIMIHEEAATDREENKINDLSVEKNQDRQIEILNKQIKSNAINYCFRAIKEVNYIKAYNYYIANIEYFNNNYDFKLTIDDFKRGINKYKSDCTEQQQKEIFFNTINNLDISVFKKLYNKYKNSNYDIKYQLNNLYLDKYNNTLDIKNITLNDCRLLNYFLEAAADREENKNSLGAENMNNKKELKPIFNTDIEGHEEYQKEELKKYNSGALNFTHKRINNKMIEEYTKYFIYKDDTFMSVKPSEAGYTSGYYEHVRKYNYKVDHVNKIILFTDKETEEVKPIKEEFYFNNDNKNKVEIIAKYDNKTLCKEGNFYFINKLDYVDMKGTKEKLIKELKRWSTEVDKNNTYMLQLEKYFIDILENIQDAEQTEQEQQIRENNNYITLTEEQKKERIELINLWSKKAPGDKEQGKERFLQLLFEYQEQKKTKEEFKKHINKLYAANKNIKAANAGKKDFNNYLIDLLATENILQKNDIIKNEFFNNAYNYIKSC